MKRGELDVVYLEKRGSRALYRRETTEDGRGWRSVFDGVEDFFYEVALDRDALDALAARAASNKSGKAKDGPLHITVGRRWPRGGER